MRLIQNYGRRANYVLSSEDNWLYSSSVRVQQFKEEEETERDTCMKDDEKEALPSSLPHSTEAASAAKRDETSSPSNPGKRLLEHIPPHVWNSSHAQQIAMPTDKRLKTGTNIQARKDMTPHDMDFVYPEDMRAKIYDMLELKQWQDQHNIPHANYH